MKHIDRYLSAYVVSCLVGYPESIHTQYMYQVLRESGSKSASPVLQAVLDLIRQGDPADAQTRKEVRQWMMARIAGAGGYNAEAPAIKNDFTNPVTPLSVPASKFEAFTSVHMGIAITSVFDAVTHEPLNLIVSTPEELTKVRKDVQEKYKNVEFHDVS